MRYTIIYSLVIFVFFSCKQTTKKYYTTGELESEFYKDDKGLKQGDVITYYRNGVIASKGYCLNDTFNGKYEEYHPNGQLKIQTMIIKGVQDGELLEYFENGQLKQSSNYSNGKENGLFTYYYSNGKKESEITMKDGYTLFFTTFDSLGNVKEKKHSMYIEILSALNKKDSVKIKEIIPGFVATDSNPMFALIEKYGTIKTGDVPKMKFNSIDSSYYITFPPQKDTGRYVIKTFFRAESKYHNEADTIITIK